MAHEVMFKPPLRVSKGALVWFPRLTKKGYKVEWEMFDEYMRGRRRAERS